MTFRRIETRVEMLSEYRQGWGSGKDQHAPSKSDGMSIASLPPEDMKLLERWLTDPNGRASLAQDQTYRLAQQIQGNAAQNISIYRAVPDTADAINPGDWVTASKYYADFHASAMNGQNGVNFHVVSADVPAAHVYVSNTNRMGNGALDLVSLGYDPS